eukprot:sb/3469853/
MGMVEIPRSESLQEFIWQGAMVFVVFRDQFLVFRGLPVCDEEVEDICDEWDFSLAEETQEFLIRTGTTLIITLFDHPIKQHGTRLGGVSILIVPLPSLDIREMPPAQTATDDPISILARAERGIVSSAHGVLQEIVVCLIHQGLAIQLTLLALQPLVMGLRLVGIEIRPTLELDLTLFTPHPPFANEVVSDVLFRVDLELVLSVTQLIKPGVEPPYELF